MRGRKQKCTEDILLARRKWIFC
uniref:Uncharacterized protein n=1 Tax=Arundo donax TaxID=35708 RepID=A0A0A9AM26_ARUDO